MCRPQILQATEGFKHTVEFGHALLPICWELQGKAWSVNTLCMLEKEEPLDFPVEAEYERHLNWLDLF